VIKNKNMSKKIAIYFILSIIAVFVYKNSIQAETVSPYYTKGLTKSADFEVKVNGKAIFTEHFEIPTPKEPNITDRERNFVTRVYDYIRDIQQVALARFPADHNATIEVILTNPGGEYKVRPIRSGMTVEQTDKGHITIKMPGPMYTQIDVEGLPSLILIPEQDPGMDIDIKVANVKYFPPGIHYAGEIKAESNQIIYIPAGAVVYGYIIGENCENLKIIGNGTLDTTNEERGRCIHFNNCSNVLVDGLMLRSSKIGWMVVPKFSRGITYRNLKILGFGTNNDGIDIVSCSDIVVENCYIRSTDDCIAIKTEKDDGTENIKVRGCTMNGYASSDGFTIGFETRNFVRHIEVSDCFIISAKGTGTSGGHSGFSIVCDGPGPISDVLFDNIHIDEVDYKNFELLITNGKHYVNMEPGSINNVTIRNVHWARADMPFMIWGFGPQNKVQNITFENCSVGGIPLKSAANGRYIINRYTDNIKFIYNGDVKMFRRF
jgi:hypothetical protein